MRQRRERDRARRAAQDSERRESTLQQIRATRSERLASVTSEEKAARLQQVSERLHGLGDYRREDGQAATDECYNRHERLASETAEERTVRLQQMSANQHERLASETVEEREIRLQYYSDRHRELQFKQRSHLITMVDMLGLPTILFTHSAADIQLPEQKRYNIM